MANTATVVYNSAAPGYDVRVNGTAVTTRTSSAEANLIRDRLNLIFSDTNRDLDFITPTYANGSYAVCCPLVRKNAGQTTYFASGGSHPEKLYESTNWSDSGIAATQSAILTIPSGATAPWYDALAIANLIRKSISLNFNDANGKSSCQQLVVPANKKATVASVISASAQLEYYGEQCQGSTSAASVACPHTGISVQKIQNPYTFNGEVFHPQGLTAAMTSTNNWNTTYKDKFVKVTNLANTSKSIVVRVTDKAPANKGIELSFRAFQELGASNGVGKVKIELMAT